MPNLQVRLTERTGARHLCSHLTGGHAGPGSRHMPALTTRPAHGPALHRTWLQPRIRPLSSRPLRLRLRHSDGWEEGKMNELWSLGTRSSAALQSASCSYLADAPNQLWFIKKMESGPQRNGTVSKTFQDMHEIGSTSKTVSRKSLSVVCN